MSPRPYHHGDLREALVIAALAAVDAGGPEALSLRELAHSLGVSTAAPYRHFPDRKALLDEVAARGFAQLGAAYGAARASASNPRAALRETARAYLNLALRRPGLFRLMFASEVLGAGSAPALLAAAGQAWEGFYEAVRAEEPDADPASIKSRAITGWSTLHGYVTLVQTGRLQNFMTEPLSEAELLEAVLDKSLAKG